MKLRVDNYEHRKQLTAILIEQGCRVRVDRKFESEHWVIIDLPEELAKEEK